MAALADHIKPEKAPGQLRRSEQKKEASMRRARDGPSPESKAKDSASSERNHSLARSPFGIETLNIGQVTVRRHPV